MARTSKFGGSSLATAPRVQNALEIIRSDPERRFVVVSAPGKRLGNDKKVTDLLDELAQATLKAAQERLIKAIYDRYSEILKGLNIDFDLDAELSNILVQWEALEGEVAYDYILSRGEYVMAKIVAEALGFKFVDAAECIRFDNDGNCNWRLSFDLVHAAITPHREQGVVFPGFYGTDLNGKDIVIFPRNASDVSGAIVANGTRSGIYEVWTDVDGIYSADPNVVPTAKSVPEITYPEMSELSYYGAHAVHPLALYPTGQADIPMVILNTKKPDAKGTLIVPNGAQPVRPREVVGVAGRRGFVVIRVDKALMNSEVGVAHTILGVFRDRGISIEHSPSGMDTMSIVIDGRFLESQPVEEIREAIRGACNADKVRIEPKLSLIAAVGSGMRHHVGMAAALFDALADAGVNIRVINQGSSELSIIVGVDDTDYDTAIKTIHNACIV